jgi:mannose-6-phosphate isomerase class I
VRKCNYDKSPFVAVSNAVHVCRLGWPAIAGELQQALAKGRSEKPILVVECYPGVDELTILKELESRLSPALAIHAAKALLPAAKIDALVAPFLGGDDPMFGRLSNFSLVNFFSAEPLWRFRRIIDEWKTGLILIVGCGASLIAWGHLLVYADLTRREAHLRFRRNEAANLGAQNHAALAGQLYKRAFFVDWRAADRWKRPLINRWDFVLDTNNPQEPKLADGEDVRRGLKEAASRPFRLLPFFDPEPWGGQWLKKICNLDRADVNSGRCFDCVPEENSLVLGIRETRFELPALDLIFHQPQALLGHNVRVSFGDEFPIRFDLVDTMGGGDLSIQVHPLPDYVRRNFGFRYTQDESHYLLDAGPDAGVYLGLRESVDPGEMTLDLHAARIGGPLFPAEKYVNRFAARKHDHFLIPAGTVHSSGANSLVLEIAAQPYLFIFRMWDWQRPGLDGKPRPLHLGHGLANVQWKRDTSWVKQNLINRFEPVSAGDGWREEKTGLHEGHFIETRRHWFRKKVHHHTHGSVNVLNLVEGEEVVVESLADAFAPFIVHYAETFIVPAAVGEYTIRPHGTSAGHECATIKAFVRTWM